LAKNLAWWHAFREAMRKIDPSVYIVGEVARDHPRELSPWFGPLNAVFDFPLAAGLIESARNERAPALLALLRQIAASIPAGQDAPFLSNHDQERVMSQLDGNLQHMRVAAAMLLTLPGQPFLYYGEELGTSGRKPDPNLREPMRWHRDPRGEGESRWKRFSADDGPQVSVEAEQQDKHSLLAWYRMLTGWRRELPVLRNGALGIPSLGNPRLAAWELTDAHTRVLVVHNLSPREQSLALNGALGRYTRIRLSSLPGASVREGRLRLPPYASAILQ
jgi:glycosidase